MVFEWVVEKYKQRRREAGIKIGIKIGEERGYAKGRAEGLEMARQENLEKRREQERQEKQRQTFSWYARRQAAFRAGLPFDEPPPDYDPDSHPNGAAGD